MNYQIELYGITHSHYEKIFSCLNELRSLSKAFREELASELQRHIRRLSNKLLTSTSLIALESEEWTNLTNFQERFKDDVEFQHIFCKLQTLIQKIPNIVRSPLYSLFLEKMGNDTCDIIVKTGSTKKRYRDFFPIDKSILTKRDWKKIEATDNKKPHVFFGNPGIWFSSKEDHWGNSFFEHYSEYIFTPKSKRTVIIMYGDANKVKIPDFSLPWSNVESEKMVWVRENFHIEDSDDDISPNNDVDTTSESFQEEINIDFFHDHREKDDNDFAPDDEYVYRENGGSWYPDCRIYLQNDKELFRSLQLRSHLVVLSENNGKIESERIHLSELQEGDCVIVPDEGVNGDDMDVPLGMQNFSNKFSEFMSKECNAAKLTKYIKEIAKTEQPKFSEFHIHLMLNSMKNYPKRRPLALWKWQAIAKFIGLTQEELENDQTAYGEYRGECVRHGQSIAEKLDQELSNITYLRRCIECEPVIVGKNGSSRILGQLVRIERVKANNN